MTASPEWLALCWLPVPAQDWRCESSRIARHHGSWPHGWGGGPAAALPVCRLLVEVVSGVGRMVSAEAGKVLHLLCLSHSVTVTLECLV